MSSTALDLDPSLPYTPPKQSGTRRRPVFGEMGTSGPATPVSAALAEPEPEAVVLATPARLVPQTARLRAVVEQEQRDAEEQAEDTEYWQGLGEDPTMLREDLKTTQSIIRLMREREGMISVKQALWFIVLGVVFVFAAAIGLVIFMSVAMHMLH